MPAPTEVHTIAEWNATLRAAKARTPSTPIIVDFHAEWCGPCKQIAPFYSQLASRNPHVVFLRVDVDGAGTRAIAAKYKVTAMPTFVAIKDGDVADTLRGADSRGLVEMVGKLKNESAELSAEAEQAKAEGNKAFLASNYQSAITQYSDAIAKAPHSAVLHGNRAYSYMKLGEGHLNMDLLSKALRDALRATELDDRWGKGWYRLAEIRNAIRRGTSAEGTTPELSEELRISREDVVQALEKAVSLSDGKVKIEAQALLDTVCRES